MKLRKLLPLAICCLAGIASRIIASEAPRDTAAAFGALEAAFSANLSADGTKLIYVGPGSGASTIAVVVDLATVDVKQIARGDANPMRLTACDWSAANRLVCSLGGITTSQATRLSVSRLLAMDADGGNQVQLGQRNTQTQLGLRQFDGNIIDWLDGVDGSVLMARSNLKERSTGALLARSEEGLGVDRVDTRTGKAVAVERPARSTVEFVSDGQGNVRLMTSLSSDEAGQSRGIYTHYYRTKTDPKWQKLGLYNYFDETSSMLLAAIDPLIDSAYVLEKLDGRWALYRIALDGSLKKELVFSHPKVDVDGVVTIGRQGRVIGAAYTTERGHVEFFDSTYKSILTTLGRALPKLPLIQIISASADEQTLAVFAGSDVDAGHIYLYDRAKRTLGEAINLRPALKGRTLSPMTPVTFPAADGTAIPGYLTLPPGATDARGLPAIVMPHGGPSARDEWGFDYWVQFYAQRGFAVLQPNFRGSAGYGDEWFKENGFRSWKISIGDVCDAGRWLVSQGVDPAKLAIVGWSYGGYAALQANVMDPDLFKAVVAVAPVTDLELLKAQEAAYTSSNIVNDFIGSGPHVEEGSPAHNVARFKSPVLMFHGDIDINVDIAQARRMDRALRRAKKSSELIVYAKLDHGLQDANARADMLRRSDAFLRAELKLPAAPP